MATIRKHLFGNSYLLFFIIVQFLLAFFKNLLFAMLEFARLFADGAESNAGQLSLKTLLKWLCLAHMITGMVNMVKQLIISKCATLFLLSAFH